MPNFFEIEETFCGQTDNLRPTLLKINFHAPAST